MISSKADFRFCLKAKTQQSFKNISYLFSRSEGRILKCLTYWQWRTLHEILGGGGGGASARGLVRFICPCHGMGVRGYAPTEKF